MNIKDLLKIKGTSLSIIAAIFTLSGCLSDSDESSSTSNVINAGSAPINIDFTKILDQKYFLKEDTLFSIYNNGDCKEDGIFEESTDTAKYITYLEGNELHIWKDGSCYAERYIGSGSKIEGTAWQRNAETNIPSPFTPERCSSHEPNEFDTGINEFRTWSNGSVSAHLTSSYCWSSQMMKFLDDNNQISTSENGCSSLNVSREGDTLNYSLVNLDIENNSGTKSFSYKGKTCTHKHTASEEESADNCMGAWNAYNADPKRGSNFYAYEYINIARDQATQETKKCFSDNNFPAFASDLL